VRNPFSSLIVSLTVAAAVCLTPAFAIGQNAQLPLPPQAPPPGNGIPDMNGVWEKPSILDLQRYIGAPPPFTPYGAEVFKNHTGADDPTGFCQPSGPARIMNSPFPVQIVQTPTQVTFLFEMHHTFHRVFTDGRSHPKDLDTTWWGDSIGRYEGNKLIIDTTGISERSWLFTSGEQHSDQLHLTQVFEKTGPETMKFTATYDDPVFYTKPWSITFNFKRSKYDIMEMICTDNNRDIPHFITSSPATPNKK